MSLARFFQGPLVAFSILAVAGFSGCGGGNNNPDAPTGNGDGGGGTIDAGGGMNVDGGGMNIDGGGMNVDGGGMNIDGGIKTNDGGTAGAFACLGDPLPTNAPTTITVSGTVSQLSTAGSSPVAKATVDFRKVSNDQSIGSTTSANDGSFTKNLSTGGSPLDDYILATPPNNASLLNTRVYPPAPQANDASGVPVEMVSGQTLGFGYSFVTGGQQTAGTGTIIIDVVDCNGNPVSGATVSASPSTGTTIAYNAMGFPSNMATATNTDGIAYIFNAPAGDVTVNANVPGVGTLRGHAVKSVTNTVTETEIEP